MAKFRNNMTLLPGETISGTSRIAAFPYLLVHGGAVLSTTALFMFICHIIHCFNYEINCTALNFLTGVFGRFLTIIFCYASLYFLAKLALAHILLIFSHIARLLGERYIITNKRVIIKSGVLSRSTTSLKMHNCDNVSFHSSWLEDMFGVGHVLVGKTFGDNLYIGPIKNPCRMHNTICENHLSYEWQTELTAGAEPRLIDEQ